MIIFDQAYFIDDPKQSGLSVVCGAGEKGLKKRNTAMSRTFKKTATADEIADMASRGEDISADFTSKFTVVRPVRRVNVDLTDGMLRELDRRAARLNISRQAAIQTLFAPALAGERAAGSRKRKAG